MGIKVRFVKNTLELEFSLGEQKADLGISKKDARQPFGREIKLFLL